MSKECICHVWRYGTLDSDDPTNIDKIKLYKQDNTLLECDCKVCFACKAIVPLHNTPTNKDVTICEIENIIRETAFYIKYPYDDATDSEIREMEICKNHLEDILKLVKAI